MAKAGQVGNVRVVDFAEAADDPVRPKRVLVILIALGVRPRARHHADASFKRAMYGGVERPEEHRSGSWACRCSRSCRAARRNCGCSTRSVLRREGCTCSPQQAPEDAAVEGVRGLRTSLQLQLEDAENNVVMITGSRPGSRQVVPVGESGDAGGVDEKARAADRRRHAPRRRPLAFRRRAISRVCRTC